MSHKNDIKALDVLPEPENANKALKNTFHGQEEMKSSMVDNRSD